MTTLVFKDAKIYLGEFDISGKSNQVALSATVEGLDDTVFGDDTRSVKPGLTAVEMSGGGFVDYTDNDVDEKLFGKVGASGTPVGVLPDGEDEGETGYVFQGNLANYVPSAAIGELMAFEFEAKNQGVQLVRATALHAATRTATGLSTARQLGAVAAGQKLYAALHVLAASGTSPTLDVVIRSDDNAGMATPTSRITFSQATGQTSEWAVPVAGAITDDYWDVSFTIGGTSPSFRFVVFVGIQ